MMQRIAGFFCAASIASLMPRYMACVIAFFFSARLSAINRVASSSVTIRCWVMVYGLLRRRQVTVLQKYPTSTCLTGQKLACCSDSVSCRSRTVYDCRDRTDTGKFDADAREEERCNSPAFTI